jgi:TIR domain
VALIFISYRREDSAGYAGRLHESLERRIGEREVFRDVDALQPGQDFVDAIAARLRDCKACLVLVGREWRDAKDASGRLRLEQENDYVRLEIATALALPNVLVVPVLVEGMAMPAAEELPASIRGLSRRHATSLRDETWDADVDRLVKALPTANRQPRVWNATKSASLLKWALLAAAVLSVILLARGFRGTVQENSTVQETDTVQGPSPVDSEPLVQPHASAIAIPRLAETVFGSMIFTVLSGDVVSSGNERTLRLRVRLSNEGGGPTNFWDDSFRLAVRGQVLSPTSGLNELVSGHSLQQGVISFKVPADATQAVLRVLDRKETAELPLDLKSTGKRSEVDTADTSDALAHASVVSVVRDARPLVVGKTISYTLSRITARRFVNKQRIIVGLRVTNHGRYPWLFDSDPVRLVIDRQATAPVDGPNEVVATDSTGSADFTFDISPSVRQIVLRIKGESLTEVPFDLP